MNIRSHSTDRVAQGATRELGEPASVARRRIRDDDDALDQKRHVLRTAKLNCAGGRHESEQACCVQLARVSTAGRIVRRLKATCRAEAILDLGAERR